MTFCWDLSRLWIVEWLTCGALRLIGDWTALELFQQVHLIPVAVQVEVEGFLWSSIAQGHKMFQLTVALSLNKKLHEEPCDHHVGLVISHRNRSTSVCVCFCVCVILTRIHDSYRCVKIYHRKDSNSI